MELISRTNELRGRSFLEYLLNITLYVWRTGDESR